MGWREDILAELEDAAIGATAGQNNYDYSGGHLTTSINQTAVVYDILSEGPIEGLVNGTNSIYLNGNPVQSAENQDAQRMRYSRDIGYNATTGVITDNLASNMFANLSTLDGTRELMVLAGKKRVASSVNTVAGSKIIESVNVSNLEFEDSDVVDDGTYMLTPMIRIEGAGNQGGEYSGRIVGIVDKAETGNVEGLKCIVDTAPAKTVSAANCSIDLIDTVASYSGATATLTTSGQGVTTANTAAVLSIPKAITLTDGEYGNAPTYNYSNFGYAFRTGTRDQPYLPTPGGIGSSSIAHNPNKKIDQTMF